MTAVKRVLAVFGLAATMLFATCFAAQRLKQSKLYVQGKILGGIIAQDGIELLPMLKSSEKRSATIKFAEAAVSAYIEFELIPYNEGDKFAAILKSINDQIHIQSFEYRRRALIIAGSADTQRGYESFARQLAASGQFGSVETVEYLHEEKQIRFKVNLKQPFIAPFYLY